VIIAFVLDDTLDRPDGVQQYILTLGTWLESRGHTVHYLVTNTTRTNIPRVHSFGSHVKFKFNGNAVRTPLPVSRRSIRSVLEKIRPDVLHVQMPYSPFFAARVIRQAALHTCIVGTFHILPASSWHTLANRLLALVLSRSDRRIQAVIAVSPPAAVFARQIYHYVPSVIPAAVDLTRFRQIPAKTEDKTENVRIVFLGRLVARKGLMNLIRAFKSLPNESRQTASLVIGGAGPLSQQARNLARGVSGISFCGFISESDKPSFLASADIAVFPSTAGESFGIILIEAMASGAGIVLGADNPGYKSVLGEHTGALVKAGSVASLRDALAHYIVDSHARTKLHVIQQQLVRDFDIANVGPRIEAVYELARPKN
jgi:phosphatidylinositol alpha-mannosyltransferase